MRQYTTLGFDPDDHGTVRVLAVNLGTHTEDVMFVDLAVGGLLPTIQGAPEALVAYLGDLHSRAIAAWEAKRSDDERLREFPWVVVKCDWEGKDVCDDARFSSQDEAQDIAEHNMENAPDRQDFRWKVRFDDPRTTGEKEADAQSDALAFVAEKQAS